MHDDKYESWNLSSTDLVAVCRPLLRLLWTTFFRPRWAVRIRMSGGGVAKNPCCNHNDYYIIHLTFMQLRLNITAKPLSVVRKSGLAMHGVTIRSILYVSLGLARTSAICTLAQKLPYIIFVLNQLWVRRSLSLPFLCQSWVEMRKVSQLYILDIDLNFNIQK